MNFEHETFGFEALYTTPEQKHEALRTVAVRHLLPNEVQCSTCKATLEDREIRDGTRTIRLIACIRQDPVLVHLHVQGLKEVKNMVDTLVSTYSLFTPEQKRGTYILVEYFFWERGEPRRKEVMLLPARTTTREEAEYFFEANGPALLTAPNIVSVELWHWNEKLEGLYSAE